MTSCPVCTLPFVKNHCIACDLCDTWYHLKCTELSYGEFLAHCHNKTLTWKCSICESNTHCAKCQVEFIPDSNQRSICCNMCNKFYHLKCSKLTLASFFELSNNNETWYCNSCTEYIFPFNSINNSKLLNCMEIKY